MNESINTLLDGIKKHIQGDMTESANAGMTEAKSDLVLHNDGTITYWSTYRQTWVKRSGRISDRELASMSDKDRKRAMRHLGGLDEAMNWGDLDFDDDGAAVITHKPVKTSNRFADLEIQGMPTVDMGLLKKVRAKPSKKASDVTVLKMKGHGSKAMKTFQGLLKSMGSKAKVYQGHSTVRADVSDKWWKKWAKKAY